MKWYQKACAAVAVDGVVGAARKRLPTLTAKPEMDEDAFLRADYERLVQSFRDKTKDIGHEDLFEYFWYHTVDLGRGVITPGAYDYRDVMPAFHFPDDMGGMNVLDVGSGTGFFAFEFEKRGANVVSVELPSFLDWDRFPGESVDQMLEKFRRNLVSHGVHTAKQIERLIEEGTPEYLYNILLDGPFRFCHETLDSKVERRYARLYDLSEETVGGSFDVVFLGDVILHTVHPLMALAAASSVCSGTLILSQAIPSLVDPRPAVLYIGGDTLGADDAVWWLPNAQCLEQLLRKLGFRQVGIVDSYAGVIKATGYRYERSIVHAIRA